MTSAHHYPETEDIVTTADQQCSDANDSKRRRRLLPHETRILLTVFEQNPRPNVAVRDRLAHVLNVSPRTIQIWFQNRRAKLRRENSSGRSTAISMVPSRTQSMSLYSLSNEEASNSFFPHSSMGSLESIATLPELDQFPETKSKNDLAENILHELVPNYLPVCTPSKLLDLPVNKLLLSQPWIENQDGGLFGEQCKWIDDLNNPLAAGSDSIYNI